MAAPRDRIKTLFNPFSPFGMAAAKVAGMMSEADATAMSEDMVDATVVLKLCS